MKYNKSYLARILLTCLSMVPYVTYAEQYTGSIEAGALISTGNSKEESLRGNVKLKYDINERWTALLKASAENKSENDLRSKEEYFVNNQTRRNIDELRYKFIELEYVNDRYGGYNYRISETLGYGYKLIKKTDMDLSLQSSVGLRQSKFTTGIKDDSVLLRVSGDFNWKLNQVTSVNYDLDISLDSDAIITKSDANGSVPNLSTKI